MVTKLQNLNCGKNKKFKLWQSSFSKNNLTPLQPMRCNQGNVLQSCDVYITQIGSAKQYKKALIQFKKGIKKNVCFIEENHLNLDWKKGCPLLRPTSSWCRGLWPSAIWIIFVRCSRGCSTNSFVIKVTDWLMVCGNIFKTLSIQNRKS